MLLLVVGLVVLVLVIVVVVFLSVRSMHADDDDSYQSTARRDTGGRSSAERDSGARRAMNAGPIDGGRRYDETASPSAPRARASQPVPAARRRATSDAQPDPARQAAAARRGGGRERDGWDREEQRVPALPRPRGYEHDQDQGDWGGVSDEQYWAELSSDNPLATTARSAQAGPPAGRTAAAATARRHPAADTPSFGDARPGDAQSGNGQFRDGQFGGAAAFGDTQFGGPPFRDGPASDASDTDPGRNGSRDATQPPASRWGGSEPAGSWGAPEEPTAAWRAADSPTAAWQAPEPSTAAWAPGDAGRRGWDTQDAPEPSWAGADEAAGDWRADEPSTDRWAAGDEPDGQSSWDAGDALTSSSFSLHGARTAGQDRHRGASAHDQAGPGWRSAVPADYDEPYGGHHGSGNGYPAALEPLPEPAGRATDWHSAPVPSGNGFTDGPDGYGWEHDAGYGSGHNGHPAADQRDGYDGSAPRWEPHGADRDWPGEAGGGAWADRDQRGWADPEPGYGQPGGYHADQGYGREGGHGAPGSSSRPGSHRGQDAGYDLPAYGTAGNGYGEQAGYGQPRHGYGSR